MKTIFCLQTRTNTRTRQLRSRTIHFARHQLLMPRMHTKLKSNWGKQRSYRRSGGCPEPRFGGGSECCLPSRAPFRWRFGVPSAVQSPASVEVRSAVCSPSASLSFFIRLHLFRSRSIHLPTRSGRRLASAPATQILPRTNGCRCAPPPPPPGRGRTARSPTGGWLAPDVVVSPTLLFSTFSNME